MQAEGHCEAARLRRMIQSDFILSLNTDDMILCQNESVMWCTDLRNTLQNLLMRRDFVSVMLFNCNRLSHSKSLTDETLSAMPLFGVELHSLPCQ